MARLTFRTTPFSMPQGGMEALESQGPLSVLGYQYDIVCNGVELSSGAIRNHKPEIMLKAFEIAGYDDAVVKEFGGMLNAFRYGAPPHGGIVLGVDRIVMLLAEQENLREAVAFPMNQQAEDLLMQAREMSPIRNCVNCTFASICRKKRAQGKRLTFQYIFDAEMGYCAA